MKSYLKPDIRVFFHPFSLLLLFLYLLLIVIIAKKIYDNLGVKADHPVDQEMVRKVEKEFVITPFPEFRYSYAIMEKGVVQHLDRNYTYDVVPKDLERGILFQGVHRLPKGTSFKIELRKAASVFIFFHRSSDGGYSEFFLNKEGWEKCEHAPQYDINNGTHGLDMLMYKLEGEVGTYYIDASTKERGCVSIVIQDNKDF